MSGEHQVNVKISVICQELDIGGHKTCQDSRGGRHQASDAESVPLWAGEAEALVKQRITQQVLPGLPDNLRLHELAVHHLARDAPPLVTGAGNSSAGTKYNMWGLQYVFCMVRPRKVPYETLLRKVRVL